MSTASIKSSILLSAFIIPTLFLASFLVQQKWIAWEMTEKLEHQQLHTLQIPVQQLHWVKEGKEILIDGKLFDVKSILTHGKLVQVTGLFDEEETDLVQQIQRQLQHNQSGRQLQTSILYSILMGFSSHLHAVQLNPLPLQRITLANYLLSPYNAPLLEQLCPPPQLV